MAEKEWVILAHIHRNSGGRNDGPPFWGPNSGGYRMTLTEAGRYSEQEAQSITAACQAGDHEAFHFADPKLRDILAHWGQLRRIEFDLFHQLRAATPAPAVGLAEGATKEQIDFLTEVAIAYQPSEHGKLPQQSVGDYLSAKTDYELATRPSTLLGLLRHFKNRPAGAASPVPVSLAGGPAGEDWAFLRDLMRKPAYQSAYAKIDSYTAGDRQHQVGMSGDELCAASAVLDEVPNLLRALAAPATSSVATTEGAGDELNDEELEAGTCTKPPFGWACRLAEGHKGPCPAFRTKIGRQAAEGTVRTLHHTRQLLEGAEERIARLLQERRVADRALVKQLYEVVGEAYSQAQDGEAFNALENSLRELEPLTEGQDWHEEYNPAEEVQRAIAALTLAQAAAVKPLADASLVELEQGHDGHQWLYRRALDGPGHLFRKGEADLGVRPDGNGIFAEVHCHRVGERIAQEHNALPGLLARLTAAPASSVAGGSATAGGPHNLDGLQEGEYHLADLENRLYWPFGNPGLPLDDANLLDHVCQYARRLEKRVASPSVQEGSAATSGQEGGRDE